MVVSPSSPTPKLYAISDAHSSILMVVDSIVCISLLGIELEGDKGFEPLTTATKMLCSAN